MSGVQLFSKSQVFLFSIPIVPCCSNSGYNFTKSDNTSVFTPGSSDDSCPPDPLRSMKLMPEGCTVRVGGQYVDKVDVGRCMDTGCQRMHINTIKTGCCGMVEQEALSVTCNDLTFTIQKITQCGCGPCVTEKQAVVVEGQIYLVTFKGDAHFLNKPWTEISFAVNGDTHTSLPSGEFMLGTERRSDVLTLIFLPNITDTYMPHIVSLSLIDGVSRYFVTVKLPPRPPPLTLNAAEDNLILSSPTQEDSPLVIEVPANSFVDANGDTVQDDIMVFVTFMNQNSSLELAPGDFMYIDEDGFRQRLITYGVINMQAMTEGGDELHLSGDLSMKIDAAALGMSQENIDDTCTWQIDKDTGFWRNCAPLIGAGNARKKRQLTGVLSSVLNAGGRPYWNLDRSHFAELCEVLVVPYDFFGIEPQPGVQIQVHSLVTGNGIARSRDIRTTDGDGKACAWVECSNNFEIFEQSGKYVPTFTHCLPNTFNFQNQLVGSIMHIYGKAPSAASITGGLEGPVHVEASKTCPNTHKKQLNFDCLLNIGKHHFQLKDKDKSQSSNIITPTNSLDHPSFRDGRVCYIRVKVEVSYLYLIALLLTF